MIISKSNQRIKSNFNFRKLLTCSVSYGYFHTVMRLWGYTVLRLYGYEVLRLCGIYRNLRKSEATVQPYNPKTEEVETCETSRCRWSWRESNPRPNREIICFLHAYSRLWFSCNSKTWTTN